MTAFVSGDSTFTDEAGNSQPLFDSPLITENSDGGVSANTAGTGLALNLTIIGDAPSNVVTDQESAPDTINAGDGNDLINVGGKDDFVDGHDGSDFIFGGSGDDTIRGGQGADFIKTGQGADVLIIKGDAENGAFGADSDLIFDEQGRVIKDVIFDFDDQNDALILEDLGLPGGSSVSYNADTGEVILTDQTSGASNIIAQMQPGLDITVTEEDDGNFTLE